MKKGIILFVCILICCSSYRKYNGEIGYSDLKVSKNVYEIEFVDKGPNRLEAKKKAYLRAAQIGDLLGYKKFTVIDEGTKSISKSKYIEGKTVIKESVDDDNEKKTEISESAPYMEKIDYSSAKITARYGDDEEMDVREYLEMGKKEGYFDGFFMRLVK